MKHLIPILWILACTPVLAQTKQANSKLENLAASAKDNLETLGVFTDENQPGGAVICDGFSRFSEGEAILHGTTPALVGGFNWRIALNDAGDEPLVGTEADGNRGYLVGDWGTAHNFHLANPTAVPGGIKTMDVEAKFFYTGGGSGYEGLIFSFSPEECVTSGEGLSLIDGVLHIQLNANGMFQFGYNDGITGANFTTLYPMGEKCGGSGDIKVRDIYTLFGDSLE